MNDDWYQFLFGRPSPGTSTTVPVLNYLREPERHPEVRRAGEVVEGARERATPPDSPRWAQRASETNARRDETARPASMPMGPGGVTGDQPEPGPAPRIPFRVASGQDTEPFGEDFAAWYEATRGRPLPASLIGYNEEPQPLSEPTPSEGRLPKNPNNIPRGVEGGETVVATRLERGVNDRSPTQRVTMAPIEGDLWDEERQAGIAPDQDPTAEWLAAEQRAFQRQREGRPTIYDMMFLAVFGPRDRRAAAAEENTAMRERIRRGEY